MTEKLFDLNIATVSYEGSLFTWKTEFNQITQEKEEEKEFNCNLNLTSGFHCSQGSLKAISISKSGYFIRNFWKLILIFILFYLFFKGKYLACGGSDERIRFK